MKRRPTVNIFLLLKVCACPQHDKDVFFINRNPIPGKVFPFVAGKTTFNNPREIFLPVCEEISNYSWLDEQNMGSSPTDEQKKISL